MRIKNRRRVGGVVLERKVGKTCACGAYEAEDDFSFGRELDEKRGSEMIGKVVEDSSPGGKAGLDEGNRVFLILEETMKESVLSVDNNSPESRQPLAPVIWLAYIADTDPFHMIV